MSLVYIPVAVRLIPTDGKSEAQSLSGIYVVDLAESSHSGFCLTICHVPAERVRSDYSIHVAAAHFSTRKVVWFDAKIVASFPVFADDTDLLFKHTRMCMCNGFNFFPNDSSAGDTSLQSLNILQISCGIQYSDKNSRYFKMMSFRKVNATSRVTIRSCPFSFTNSNLFADFRSTGHINMVIRDDTNHYGYLSDVKYLENMIGGVAIDESSSFTGLVLGNLRKINGDGDLVVMLPWERVLLNLSFLRTHSKLHSGVMPAPSGKLLSIDKCPASGRESLSEARAKMTANELNKLSEQPVFPIVLSENNSRISWGSCVLLNSACLITNHHVIHPYQARSEVKCEIIICKTSSFQLQKADKVIRPFEHLDLAFIILSSENQLRFSSVDPIHLKNLEKISFEDSVYSLGYGLFLNDSLGPLVSMGHISTSLSLSPFHEPNRYVRSPKPVPCLLITSCPSWNGSSGGGLFSQDGSFLGLVCCNAEVRVPLLPGEHERRVEKLPSVCFCIPSELILECYRLKVVDQVEHVSLNNSLVNAWKLEPYHKDVYRTMSKL